MVQKLPLNKISEQFCYLFFLLLLMYEVLIKTTPVVHVHFTHLIGHLTVSSLCCKMFIVPIKNSVFPSLDHETVRFLSTVGVKGKPRGNRFMLLVQCLLVFSRIETLFNFDATCYNSMQIFPSVWNFGRSPRAHIYQRKKKKKKNQLRMLLYDKFNRPKTRWPLKCGSKKFGWRSGIGKKKKKDMQE